MEGGGSTREQQQPWSYSCSFPASFAWPPRSYTCSFCKREFRSAQALGGHMNVHRRERARLRHCSPPPPATAAPNPRSAAATAGAHRAIPNLNYPPPPQPLPLYYPKRSPPPAANAMASPEVRLEMGVGAMLQCCTKEVDDGLDLELRLGSSMRDG